MQCWMEWMALCWERKHCEVRVCMCVCVCISEYAIQRLCMCARCQTIKRRRLGVRLYPIRIWKQYDPPSVCLKIVIKVVCVCALQHNCLCWMQYRMECGAQCVSIAAGRSRMCVLVFEGAHTGVCKVGTMLLPRVPCVSRSL